MGTAMKIVKNESFSPGSLLHLYESNDITSVAIKSITIKEPRQQHLFVMC